ncbi:MAG: segregation/condensation protein A [Methylovulum sp.]|nr:segregation/condensation protein A [Methylovulum sp.]
MTPASEHESIPLIAARLALVNGTPVNQLPEDLYIPPDALEVFLSLFEGPLDLLLYLIKRQNFDIVHIPIAEITQQYIHYIELMGLLNIELAAEYLVMAALLAEIKSRMLLPRHPTLEEEDDDDPRATLIKRLQEYERIREATELMDKLPRMERDVLSPSVDFSLMAVQPVLPEVDLQDLLLAFQDVLKRVDQLSHHHITKEALSVRERMATILAKLKGEDSLFFSQLFIRKEGRQGVVVTFLAVLELSKERLISITQSEPFAVLSVQLIGAGNASAYLSNEADDH